MDTQNGEYLKNNSVFRDKGPLIRAYHNNNSYNTGARVYGIYCTEARLWYVKAWRARVRKYTEIVEDYGGVANGCQLSLLAKEWSVGQRTSR